MSTGQLSPRGIGQPARSSAESPRGRLKPGLIRLLGAILLLAPASTAQTGVQTPEQFFGFRIGTDGELARYPRVLEYLQHLAHQTDRVRYEELGRTTLGNSYVLATISAPSNLLRLERLVEINRRLADPRGLSETEAGRLAREGRPFYFLYATIHSTEVGNGQAVIEIAHRLATGQDEAVQEILDNTVLLLVPSQNPDGQQLVIDHWYETKGTPLARVYPDLYHRYTGHDNNRDWFMLTQKETRLAVGVHSRFKPQLTHDMHQTSPLRARIFVPPFDDPYDANIHPILREAQAQVGIAMRATFAAEGKQGAQSSTRYDLWTPARQYMAYHGQPRILTEIASVNLADPFVNPAGPNAPLGPREVGSNFPMPYASAEWRLRQIVDYGITAVTAGLTHVAKYRVAWLENFYKVHRDWLDWSGTPAAFVVSAEQRDPFETYELLEILHTAQVEMQRARAPFSAGGKSYPEGSWVIPLAQPYGAFAKTMLERQAYPDLRLYPGGPPKAPYDVAGHTLGLLMGVAVDAVDAPIHAELEPVRTLEPPAALWPGKPRWGYVIGPESNAGSAPCLACSEPAFRCFARSRASRLRAVASRPGRSWCRRREGQCWGRSRARRASPSPPQTRRPRSTRCASSRPRASACGRGPATCPAAGCSFSSSSTTSNTASCPLLTSTATSTISTTSSCCPREPARSPSSRASIPFVTVPSGSGLTASASPAGRNSPSG
jgi:hypothetical protein